MMALQDSSPKPPCRLIELPTEIRLQIYSYLFNNETADTSPDTLYNAGTMQRLTILPPIMETCRLVRKEMLSEQIVHFRIVVGNIEAKMSNFARASFERSSGLRRPMFPSIITISKERPNKMMCDMLRDKIAQLEVENQAGLLSEEYDSMVEWLSAGY